MKLYGIILAFSTIFMTTSAVAQETIVIPVQDLLMEIPNFDSPPDFDFNSALNGRVGISNPPKAKRETRKERERRLIELVEDMYPDSTVRIWNGNLIVRIP